MNRSSKIAVGIAASLTLGLAAAAYAHQGETGSGTGPHAMNGMQHPMKSGMGPGAGHGRGGQGTANQLMTPEEQTALRKKMRNATPEHAH